MYKISKNGCREQSQDSSSQERPSDTDYLTEYELNEKKRLTYALNDGGKLRSIRIWAMTPIQT